MGNFTVCYVRWEGRRLSASAAAACSPRKALCRLPTVTQQRGTSPTHFHHKAGKIRSTRRGLGRGSGVQDWGSTGVCSFIRQHENRSTSTSWFLLPFRLTCVCRGTGGGSHTTPSQPILSPFHNGQGTRSKLQSSLPCQKCCWFVRCGCGGVGGCVEESLHTR